MAGDRITREKSKDWSYIKSTYAFSFGLKLMGRSPYRTLEQEWKNLIDLQKQSLGRKIADHEGDKGRIAEIFERINQAREQLVVCICVIVIIFRVPFLLPSV
jgi:hypothetical protein